MALASGTSLMTIDTDAEDRPRYSAISLRPGSFAGASLCTPIFFETRFTVFPTDSAAALLWFLDCVERERSDAIELAPGPIICPDRRSERPRWCRRTYPKQMHREKDEENTTCCRHPTYPS